MTQTYILVDAGNSYQVGSLYGSITDAVKDWHPGLAVKNYRVTPGRNIWPLTDAEVGEALSAAYSRGKMETIEVKVSMEPHGECCGICHGSGRTAHGQPCGSQP